MIDVTKHKPDDIVFAVLHERKINKSGKIYRGSKQRIYPFTIACLTRWKGFSSAGGFIPVGKYAYFVGEGISTGYLFDSLQEAFDNLLHGSDPDTAEFVKATERRKRALHGCDDTGSSGIRVTFTQKVEADKLDALWYKGEIVTIEKDGYKFSILANGDVRWKCSVIDPDGNCRDLEMADIENTIIDAIFDVIDSIPVKRRK